MVRFEIIANQSVYDDMLVSLETALPQILYTLFPVVYGRGKRNRKLETTIWPETNFALVTYVADEHCDCVRETVRTVKSRFPGEGVVLFEVQAATVE